jgi:hypothetical protein
MVEGIEAMIAEPGGCFRSLAPKAVKDVPLELMATVPGSLKSPASRVCLYDTNEHKHWAAPSTVTITP